MAVSYSIYAVIAFVALVATIVIFRKKIKYETYHLIDALSDTQQTNYQAKSDWFSLLYEKLNPLLTQLSQQKAVYDATLNAINDAVIRTDTCGNILHINHACHQLFELDTNELINKPYACLKASVIQDELKEGFEQIFAKIKAGQLTEQVFKSTYKAKITGQMLTIEQHVKGVFNADDQFDGCVIVLRDVTRAEQMKARLRYQANYDSVTKLFNRYKFEQKLTDAWHDAQENREQHALIQLDMDRFKLVNDNPGHAAGDQLLREVGQLLRQTVRKSDICARVGGDEFAILLMNIEKQHVVAILEKLNEAFRTLPFSYNGQIFDVGASIGATLVNHKSPPLVEVKRQADAACFMAKNKGINCYQLFDYNNESLITHQQEPRWAARINQALERDEFTLFCQTIKPLNSAEDKLHIEVLLRLDTGEQILSPTVFLPAVERFRLSSKVDLWVVVNTFNWLEQHPHYWSELVVSINLSADSITNHAFIEDIIECYQAFNFPTDAICFEITETAAIANMSDAIKLVTQLREVGFIISLDDFGKGFSTFSYLKNLPAQYIKIDGSYVQNILDDKCDFAIVHSINTLAKSLGMKTIAEFVQCDKAQQVLLDVGVDFVQGYGIDKPMALANYQIPAAIQ